MMVYFAVILKPTQAISVQNPKVLNYVHTRATPQTSLPLNGNWHINNVYVKSSTGTTQPNCILVPRGIRDLNLTVLQGIPEQWSTVMVRLVLLPYDRRWRGS